MGNSHSNEAIGNNFGNGFSENMIVDLDGKYHIEYKNRNFKKLKPQMFSTYFEHYEIVKADTLINSDFIKNKGMSKNKQLSKGGENNNSSNNLPTITTTSTSSSSTTTTTETSNSEQKDRLEQENKEEQDQLNSSFLKSSPVPSPSSSVSKKFESEFQLNPELTLESFNENEEKRKLEEEEKEKKAIEDSGSTKNEIINNKSSSTTNIKQVVAVSQSSRSTSIPAFNRKNVNNNNNNNKDKQDISNNSKESSNLKKNKKENKKEKDGASIIDNSNNNIISVKSDIKIFSVDLSINRLENITNDILSIMAKFEIRELCLSTNFFQIIPDLQIVRSLTTINLTRNKVSKLQTSVFIELPSLTSLTLDRNLYVSLLLFMNLHYSNSNNNSITSIPDDIDQIKNLKYLSIKHNALEILPNSFSNLKSLVSLDLSQNKLKSLPPNFDDLINLQMVWLSYNQITVLPQMIKLVNLILFDISSNKLQSLSKDFAYLAPPRSLKQQQQQQDENDSITLDECTNSNNNNNSNNTNNNCSNNNNNNITTEMLNIIELENGGLGCLRELNIRDNRELITIPVEYKQVESIMNISTSIPSEIIPGLFLGGLDSANNAPILQTLGITHIVLAIGDCEPFFPKTFRYYSIDDARDTPQYDISQHFEQTNCFIEAGRKAGGVLVHCRAGISRSSTLIISYLMKYNRLTFKQAMDIVQSKRPQVLPNPGFKDQLLKYEAKLFCNNILKRNSIIVQNNTNNNNNTHTIPIDSSSTSTTPNLSSMSSDNSTIISKLSINQN